MIDWDHVRELRDEIGTDAFEEVVEMFLDEVETEIGKLRAPPADLDLEAQLHFIKGSALNLGFSEFSELCQSGEAQAARGGGEAVKLREILASFDRSKAVFLAGLGAEVSTG
ncbi:Hpt domain-containing protein [Roseovarius sp. D22-M7]|uniref:Hpt domain-containing protein n=1 Tax=Roseovarius sp. D22-M7 TaxID=3127116 RepID=UPI00301002AC